MLGQHSVFESSSAILKQFLRLEVSAKQIQRISEWYGKQINPIIKANHTEYIPHLGKPKTEDEPTYVMMDGSMVNTIDEKWKEMKLARMFHKGQNIDIQPKRNEIQSSIYVSHLGSVNEFFPKLERHLAGIGTKKVFIADGAKWIWNWVEDNYPGATQILDYYHAVEKIETLARAYFKNEEQKKKWLQEQKKLLLEDAVAEVIGNIQSIKSRNQESSQAKETAIQYYTEHEDRMLYKTFREKGLLIGSGPIEAAHRNVIQQRLKLSGQKWSVQGAQGIANLRCYQQSGAWSIIQNLIRLAA
jgi:hypothetical protein